MKIKDIRVEFEGDTLTKYGLFALLVWFLVDILHLSKRFKLLTVKNKRNRERPIKRRYKPFPASKMCLALVVIILLGVKRFEKIRPLLSTEEKLANLLGLHRFFGVTTARNFINEFSLWHLRQLDLVNTQILKEFGQSTIQDLPILDIDGSTHSLRRAERDRRQSLALTERTGVNLVTSGQLVLSGKKQLARSYILAIPKPVPLPFLKR